MTKPSVFDILIRFWKARSAAKGGLLGTLVFLFLRWLLTPYRSMEQELPRSGLMLDLGGGHGLLSYALSFERGRTILSTDHDSARIQLAQKAFADISNLRFGLAGFPCKEGQDLPGDPAQTPRYDGIAIIDALHYFSPAEQRAILSNCYRALRPEAVLIFREVDPDAKGPFSAFNQFYEKVATTIGFTRSNNQNTLHFRSRSGWLELLRELGCEAHAGNCSAAIFSDVLFVVRKGKEPHA